MSLLAVSNVNQTQTFSIERDTPVAASNPSVFETTLNSTNEKLMRADEALEALARGEERPLHQTMIAIEEAKMSLHLMVQIRNRLLSAYHDVLREQI